MEMAERIRELREIAGYTDGADGVADRRRAGRIRGVRERAARHELCVPLPLRAGARRGRDGPHPGLQPDACRSYTLITRAGDGPAHRAGARHDLLQHGRAVSKSASPSRCTSTADYNDEAAASRHRADHARRARNATSSSAARLQASRWASTPRCCTPATCIYYDSSTPHGMIAVGGEDCRLLRHRAATAEVQTRAEAQKPQENRIGKEPKEPAAEVPPHLSQLYPSPKRTSDGALQSL